MNEKTIDEEVTMSETITFPVLTSEKLVGQAEEKLEQGRFFSLILIIY